VCVKDPGYDVDLVFRGNIADFVAVYCGHVMWSETNGKILFLEGEDFLARQLPGWLKFDRKPDLGFPNDNQAA
jgi:hypothetical protein